MHLLESRVLPPGSPKHRLYLRLLGKLQPALGRLFRPQLIGMTLDEEYQLWLQKNTDDPATLQRTLSSLRWLPKISVVMPVFNTDERWLKRAIESVLSQIYPSWELCAIDDASTDRKVMRTITQYASEDDRIHLKRLERHQGIAGASNHALRMATGEFVGLMDHDDELTPDACLEVAKALNVHPEADYLYSDEDKLDWSGRRVEVFFKPDWSPDLHLSMNYVAHFSVFRKSMLDKVGGFRAGFEGSQDYDLILRVTELTERIHHIPRPLYSWRKVPGSAASSANAKPYAYHSAKRAIMEALARRGLQAYVKDVAYAGLYRVKYKLVATPLVSIILPVKGRFQLLRRCLTSIKSKSTYPNYELIAVDCGIDDSKTVRYLANLPDHGIRVIEFHGEFNYSRLYNFAVEEAGGAHLVFLRNEIEVISRDWIEAMLEHSQRKCIGAVAAGLFSCDGKVQSGGLVIGPQGYTTYRVPVGNPGYFGLPYVIRNCSAVTAACMMIRKEVFERLQGFNESFGSELGDLDFCLRARGQSLQVVCTPYAVLRRFEDPKGGRHIQYANGQNLFVQRWGRLLCQGDPYYNPNLDLHRPYRIVS